MACKMPSILGAKGGCFVKEKVYITRQLPKELLKDFRESFEVEMWDEADTPVPQEVLKEKAQSVDALFCTISEKLDAAFFEANRHLKIVANMAVGFDNIDTEAARQSNVIVTNTPDVLTESTADLTFALLMATARRLLEANQVIRQDKWGDWAPFFLTGADVHHKTIGIVGMGRIGQAVARRARGFSMNVLYHNRSRKEDVETNLGVRYASFDRLIEAADFVVSLVPATKETKHLFNETSFKKMKSSAIFINVSRGQVVNEAALFSALKNKEIAACGLDVFDQEPIGSDHPLNTLPNAVLMPHIGSASYQTRVDMIQLCLDNIKAVLQGEKPKTPVN